jgi:hypothetical protein
VPRTDPAFASLFSVVIPSESAPADDEGPAVAVDLSSVEPFPLRSESVFSVHFHSPRFSDDYKSLLSFVFSYLRSFLIGILCRLENGARGGEKCKSVPISARRRRLFSMSCVIFCLWIRGDHVESLPLKSKSAQGENAARTLSLTKLLRTTERVYHNYRSGGEKLTC